MPQTPTPVLDDSDTGGFWQAAQRGALAVQWCWRCAQPVHLPRPQCPRCGSSELGWHDVDGTATVYSWAVVRHPVHPAFPVPYTVALVALTDHPSVRLMAHFDGTPPLREGLPVRCVARPDAAGVLVPQWELVTDDRSMT
ncbi:Zn-ribbon domain-containing OB-fold protein [Mycolicibacterium holsaticum]|uniref:Zn-ribbon domain-containing OB-fold protein n=1 Tax=Mycolicibacterium holsaticum TaxID=152142 RepID=UPI001C7E140F|nr:OB-fold domain-containing protein [Mycolicibacterium holsaticum]MDA4108129.1 hypothetical protein [Mycolicibacterium holsaticum DSM 44478 = JCM 12374]QZA14459.1 OB-fold domain-containing protein [Mycolicibacterium holsaticum DSM 44478 = JCM 12374]UNC08092.1 OB-fold domain-containing protein [Mycolicibacterium holsaticum DSM 44478 = JCM 12374]